ncbi:MAG: sialidase family protein [Verrucomicrobiales bacterium]|nr:sialidase family protein [Verrucomicrobiales bacterium]
MKRLFLLLFLPGLAPLFSLCEDAETETVPKSIQHIVAVKGVCAWPNMTLMEDGTIIAVLHNQASHGQTEGDIECWASPDGINWKKRSTITRHDPDTVRMNHAAGLTKDGDLIVLCSGWTNQKHLDRPKQAAFRDDILRPWILRSKDGGKSWSRETAFPGSEDGWSELIPFGDIWPDEDGHLHVSCYQGEFTDPAKSTKTKSWRSWHLKSEDDGTTWKKTAVIGPTHNETTLLPLGEGRWLAAARTRQVDILRSDDNGESWISFGEATGRNEINGHLLNLADGRILHSYGVRVDGRRGVCARISIDEGQTWGAAIRLAETADGGDCGYPSSVQREDGSIVTAWYSNQSPQHDGYHMGVTVWSLPQPIVSVSREIYLPNTETGLAPWVYAFPGKPGYREEIHTVWSHENQVKGYGDAPSEPYRRFSFDDGKTWSGLEKLPPFMNFLPDVSILDWKFCGLYDPTSDRLVSLSIHHVRDMRDGPPRAIYNHGLIRLSEDDGKTWSSPQVLQYEDGADLDPENVLAREYLENNTAYPGQSILRHSNGTLIIPVTNSKIPADVEDTQPGPARWPSDGTIGSLCLVGKWNAEKKIYEWEGGKPVWITRDLAVNGLLEADIAELPDGRVFIVWRVTRPKGTSAYKWCSVSEDGGLTFSEPRVFTYSDGSHFFSNSTFHRLFRSSKTSRLYWIGNILAHDPPTAGHPRYPLVIAEVDEDTLGIIKETVTQIDTRRPGEGKQMQLSNFWCLEQEETGDLEIFLTRLYEDPDDLFTASAYRYVLRFHES